MTKNDMMYTIFSLKSGDYFIFMTYYSKSLLNKTVNHVVVLKKSVEDMNSDVLRK